MAKLVYDIEALDAKNATVLENINALANDLQAEEEKLRIAQEASIVAQNQWAAQESASVLAKDAVDDLEAQAKVAAQNLTKTEQALAGKVSALKAHQTKNVVEDDDVQMVQEASP